MDPSNPYAAPRTEEVTRGVPASASAAGRGLGGSELAIGERRSFTGAWLWRNLLTKIGLSVAAMVIVSAIAGLALPVLAARVGLWGLPDLTDLGLLAGVAVAFLHQGLPRIGGASAVAIARERGGFTTDLTFVPRLPTRFSERRDTADDVGVAWIDGDWLHFEGDRVRMRLHRAAVRSIARQPMLITWLIGIGSNLRIELAEPLAGQSAFTLNARSFVHGPRTSLSARRLKRTIEAWFAGATGGAASG